MSNHRKVKENNIAAWFLVVLLGVLAFAVLMAIVMAYSRRANGQNSTIVERGRSRDGQKTTVIEGD